MSMANIKVWFEKLSEEQFNVLCEILDEVDDIQIYWFVQDCRTIIVEGPLFDKRNDPPLTIEQINDRLEK